MKFLVIVMNLEMKEEQENVKASNIAQLEDIVVKQVY